MAELTWEILYMSVSVLGIGYVLHRMAYSRGLGDDDDVVKRVKKPVKESNGKVKQIKQKTDSGILEKWLDFGGGYYGTIAFVKLIFIELNQFRGFVSEWTSLGDFIQTLGLDFLIRFFVDQIMNFVAAISWPADYFSHYQVSQIAVFVGVTYVAYKLSSKLARRALTQQSLKID